MRKAAFLLGALAIVGLTRIAMSHCEVPCGIYDDQMRIEMIREDLTTVEKAMKKIEELSSADEKNMNQIVRWVTTKEEHAEKVQHVVWQYFMTQRVKVPAADADVVTRTKYEKQLVLLHQILVAAMKAKQTTDPAHVAHARELVTEFARSYFSPEDFEHLKEDHGD